MHPGLIFYIYFLLLLAGRGISSFPHVFLHDLEMISTIPLFSPCFIAIFSSSLEETPHFFHPSSRLHQIPNIFHSTNTLLTGWSQNPTTSKINTKLTKNTNKNRT